jgi:DNA-binding response OmpR family regulator
MPGVRRTFEDENLETHDMDSGRALAMEQGENTMRILLVEDDQRIAGFMKRGLEAEAYEVDLASEKSQTLALIDACAYDIILLDIFLGPDDGLDICRVLRQQSVGTPILIMTAKDSTETRQASEEAGADAYLPKPFPFDDLLATIISLHESCVLSESLKGIQTEWPDPQKRTDGVYKSLDASSK